MDFTIEALRARAGDGEAPEPVDLGTSDWVLVDQDRIDAFADATEDHQWIHIDVERARESPAGTTIAHGFLLLSLVPKLFTGLFQVSDAEMLINYGIDKVRFLKPVPAGSELRLAARVESVTPRGGNLLLRIRGDLQARAAGRDENAGRSVVLETLFLVVPPS